MARRKKMTAFFKKRGHLFLKRGDVLPQTPRVKRCKEEWHAPFTSKAYNPISYPQVTGVNAVSIKFLV